MSLDPDDALDTDISGSRGRDMGPRDRMIAHAADLIGRDGVPGTSIGDVLAASKAPRGSIYHHFPGGKSELMTEAVRFAGEFVSARIADTRAGSAADAVFAIGDVWRKMLVNTDFQRGCPVLAGGLARRSEPATADEADAIFRRWRHQISARLVYEGVDDARADSLATLVISGIEGAVGVSLTQRSVEPLDSVITELARLCESAVVTG